MYHSKGKHDDAFLFPLPHLKTFLERYAYSLFLQCFPPTMRKRSRSKDDWIHLSLVAPEAAIWVQDNGLLVVGNEAVGQRIQHSLDLSQHLGQPEITAFRVAFQEREAVIRLGDHHFLLPFDA